MQQDQLAARRARLQVPMGLGSLAEWIATADLETQFAIGPQDPRLSESGARTGAYLGLLYIEREGEFGLDFCPLEAGPYLRLQYLDQPEGFWVIVSSHNRSERSDVPNGFYLRRLEDGLWLRGY